MPASQCYPNAIKAHKFVHLRNYSRCSCGNWFLSGATEASAIRSHQLHIKNLPDDRVLNPVTPAKQTPTPTALGFEYKPSPARLGTLCPQARCGIAQAKDVLGEQAVKGLLQTVTFRTASFECVDRWR